ncbi:MAG: DNA translocase FtsK [Planctomycetes bacterium]|nr:DNA translocase FtsK [Planctomycetota bacterium]
MFDYTRLKTDLLALAILALAVFIGLSLVSFDAADPPAMGVYPVRSVPQNLGGLHGATVAQALITSFGIGAYFLLAALVVADIRLFARDSSGDPLLKLLGAAMMLTAVCVAAQWFLPLTVRGSLAGSGGYIGAWGSILLDANISRIGSLILLGSMFASGLLLAGEQHLVGTALSLSLLPVTIWSRLAFGRRPKDPPASVVVDERLSEEPAIEPVVGVSRVVSSAPVPTNAWYSSSTPDDSVSVNAAVPEAAAPAIKAPAPAVAVTTSSPEGDCTVFTLAANRAPIRVNPPMGMKSAAVAEIQATEPEERLPFQLPDASLLEDAEAFPYDVLAAKAQIAAATLERTFEDFGLNVKVVEIDTGPVITQFELELEKGLRLSKVTALADDLAIALRVASVRVVAPIPGKNTVGVEVPNDVRVMVRLKELLQTCQADFTSKGIPLFLGKDVSGKPLVVDMCKLPHLLIAGRTGTGKSVCLNTLILSMLLSRSPDQVKMLMIDPKMVELSPYSRIPHLMHPVITDMKKAEAVLGWAVDKMEERYDLLARVGVRHLDSYNQMGKAKVLRKLDIDPDSDEADLVPETMPYIVIVADEMADMMMTSGKDVEAHIIRLAQKSRAVGIHLVLATQKPTVDVITGLIKSNLPARISFQVASRMDSRVVLDEMGADKLLGNGDLLYMAPGTSTLRRAQGTYVSDDEVNKVIEFFADQQPEYDQELMQLNVSSGSAKGGKSTGEPRERDDLYEQAVAIVIREGRGSVSLLQRALGVGYGRGARMIDWMAEDGIVGTYNGSQAREVVMTMQDWEDSRDMVATR